MQGASEFTIGGVLADWNIVDRLHKIIVPTVVMTSEFDSKYYQSQLIIILRYYSLMKIAYCVI